MVLVKLTVIEGMIPSFEGPEETKQALWYHLNSALSTKARDFSYLRKFAFFKSALEKYRGAIRKGEKRGVAFCIFNIRREQPRL